MTNFSVILNDMTNFEIDKSKYINNLNRKELLIIDDFGMERDTDFAAEHIFNIIDGRYRSGKPLIITTNLNISALTNPETIKDKIDIRFHKVESHTGVKYNDLADSLAKDALFN